MPDLSQNRPHSRLSFSIAARDSRLKFLALIPLAFCAVTLLGEETLQTYRDFNAAPHEYQKRQPRDRFSRMMERLQDDPRLDFSSEKAFVTSFLNILEVPTSSQMLVFSTTSLQLRFISPSNPRAIYFSDDIYVGYIPGARLEVVSLDPEVGAIFYIFDIPVGGGKMRFERSDRCMNCHAGEDTGYVPGLVIKSVITAPSGGSLETFRPGQSGHAIPLSERFGGWHVTGRNLPTNHLGNLTGRYLAGVLQKIPNEPGQRFDFGKYPAKTSDILAHLIHEHQVGFVNRAIEAGYRTRTALYLGSGKLTDAQEIELDDQARLLTRYLLFADEAVLPAGGIEPDPTFEADFLRGRRASTEGLALKDLDLKTRLFKHRCSHMIYSPVFEGLPAVFKTRVYQRIGKALNGQDQQFTYLPETERFAIRRILKSTLDDLPAGALD
jgi:hypothetical protein